MAFGNDHRRRLEQLIKTSNPIDFQVLEDDGDIILKIVNGFEKDTYTSGEPGDVHESGITDTDMGEDDRRMMGQSVTPTTAQYRIIHVQVSKDKLCDISAFFTAMLKGDFAEGQHDASKEIPPVVKLQVMDCDAALSVLRCIFNPGVHLYKELENGVSTYDILVHFVQLAEMWDCLSFLRRNVSAKGAVALAFNRLPKQTRAERAIIFREKLVDLFDVAELLGDESAYGCLTQFVIDHEMPDTYQRPARYVAHYQLHDAYRDLKPRFIAKTQSFDILMVAQDYGLSIKYAICNMLWDLTRTLTGGQIVREEVANMLVPFLILFQDSDGKSDTDWDSMGPCARGVLRCRYLLPVLQAITFDRDGLHYNGSLEELSSLVLNAYQQLPSHGGVSFHDRQYAHIGCTGSGREEQQSHSYCDIYSVCLHEKVKAMNREAERRWRPFCMDCWCYSKEDAHPFHRGSCPMMEWEAFKPVTMAV